MNIRAANIGDADAIAEIHVRSWQKAYAGIVPQKHLDGLSIDQRGDQWRRNFSEGKSFRTYLAEIDGEVVGFVGVGASRDDDAPPDTAEVGAIYLSPTRWRQGVGRALWKKACADAAETGAETITAWVLEENGSARAFYEAMGCSDSGLRRTMDIGGLELTVMRFTHTLSRTRLDTDGRS